VFSGVLLVVGLLTNSPYTEGFRVKKTLRQWLFAGKRSITRRLDKTVLGNLDGPMLSASNIHYEVGGRVQGMVYGGIGVIHLVARHLGLSDAIDLGLHVLKIHLPYTESDHVLNIAYNACCGGTCLEDIEIRRTDQAYLNALDARRIPDPTTAGDFCRRFDSARVDRLQDIINEVQLRAWKVQPDSFFSEARVDFDGHLLETTGERKDGMSLAYDGTWGYHPLLVTLRNTGEVLRIVNRSGNRPSSEGAAVQADRMIGHCRQAGFRRILLRGDTDFSQTEHLDRWNAQQDVRFIFGYDAKPNLNARADELPETAWIPLKRPPRYEVETQPRRRRENVKERVVQERGYENQTLQEEQVAEFSYQPTACQQSYRMVVLRKHILVQSGQRDLFKRITYFFYITNDWSRTPAEIVELANDRCQQENLIEQLRNGVHSLRAPVDNLLSNAAYMVMAALGWNLKAWAALLLPTAPGRWQERHQEEKEQVLRMEFKKFVNAFIRIPCQIIRAGRRIIYRLLGWNPWQGILFRLLDVLRC